MWNEIGNISGIPFHSSRCLGVGIDDELQIANLRSEALTKELNRKTNELDFASETYAETKSIYKAELSASYVCYSI